MRHVVEAVPEEPGPTPEAAAVVEIAIAPGAGSFSIVTGDAAGGSAYVSLAAGELPRLMVALLRTAELLERERGRDHSLTFPIERGSIALWNGEFVFTVTLTAGASMTFQLDRAAAQSLLEALTIALHCPMLPRSATH